MACIINLFETLGGLPQTTGTWVFTSTTNGSGNAILDVDDAGSATYNPGNAVGTDNDPMVDFTGAADADYVFTYTTGSGGSCQDTAEVTVTVIAGVFAGVNNSVTLCNNEDLNYVLWDLINGSGTPSVPGGTITGGWTGDTTVGNGTTTGYIPGGAGPEDDAFNPNTITVGTYTYFYTVTQTGAEEDCDDCSDQVQVTIIVDTAPNAGDDAAITVCRAYTP